MFKRLDLTDSERDALTSALENYLNGNGMQDDDEDENVLETVLARLQEA